MGMPGYFFEDVGFFDLWQRIAIASGLDVRAKESECNENEYYSVLHRMYHVSRGQGQVNLSVSQMVHHDNSSSIKDNCITLWTGKEGCDVASYLERIFLTAGGIGKQCYGNWSYIFRCEDAVSRNIRKRKMVAGIRFDITTCWKNSDDVNAENAYTEFMIRGGDNSVLAAIGPTVDLNSKQNSSLISIGSGVHTQKTSVTAICDWLMNEGCINIVLQ